jgi:putative flippase GtrA
VGILGFMVDAILLTAMISYLGWGVYSARLVSGTAAILSTWFLNRQWTFRDRASDNKIRESSTYLVINCCGAAINFSVYGIGVYLSSTLLEYPVLAAAMGAITAMLFNFTASKRYAFTG